MSHQIRWLIFVLLKLFKIFTNPLKFTKMNKSTYRIAIIGNGKLAKSITLGLLRAGFRPGQIIVIGRETSDLEWFSKKVNTSRYMEEIATASHIIIAVTPVGCGDTLTRISKVGLQRLFGYEFISFASGLMPEQISNFIPESVAHRTISATCNTNIAYGSGIVHSTRDSELLRFLVEDNLLIERKPEKIINSIVGVGSFNALHCVGIDIAKNQSGMTLEKWLNCAENSLSGFNFPEEINQKDPQHVIKEYLSTISIISSRNLNYTISQAEKLTLNTFSSTISALRTLIKEGVENPTIKLRESVVTPGGCTEKGVNKILTPDQLTSRQFMEEEVVVPILNVANTFPSIVSESIKKSLRV